MRYVILGDTGLKISELVGEIDEKNLNKLFNVLANGRIGLRKGGYKDEGYVFCNSFKKERQEFHRCADKQG